MRLSITLILLVSASSACARMGATGSVTVDTAPIHYATKGEGSPVVVFDAGAGDDMRSWKDIVGPVSAHARVFAFDRPGYGGHGRSDTRFDTDADGARTSEEVARHLRIALDLAGFAPPFVLVGHSMGGLNMLAFAKLFPDDVQGVVLVDGRPRNFSANVRTDDVKGFTVPRWMTFLLASQMRLELRGGEESEAFAADPCAYKQIPITVIAANRSSSPLTSQSSQAYWVRKQKPELVIGEILRMVRCTAECVIRAP